MEDKGLFDKFTYIVEEMDDDLKSSFFEYTDKVRNNPNSKDGALMYMILSLMKQNYEIKEELDYIRKSHTSLMNIYADNN